MKTHWPGQASSLTDVAVLPNESPASQMHYDGFDRQILNILPDGRMEAYSYGPREMIVADFNGNELRRVMAVWGAVVSVVRYDGAVSATPVRVYNFVRDGTGKIVRVTDSAGSTRSIVRDEAGRPRYITLPHKGVLAPSVLEYCYALNDEPTVVTTPEQRLLVMQRDGLGRIYRSVAELGANSVE